MNIILKFLDKVKYFGFRKLFYVLVNALQNTKERLIDYGILRSNLQQTLIKRRGSRNLIEDFYGFWGHGVDNKQFFLGLGLIHYALVRNLRPKKILCIGSKQGFIPAILAAACKDNGFGYVDFVDAGYDDSDPKNHWGGVGYWKKEGAFDNFKKHGLFDYIRPYIMTTEKFVKKFPRKKYNYVYVDGDHSYEGVKSDYKYFWPKLDKGGFMAIHDISERGFLSKGEYGVWKFWSEIDKKHTIVFPNSSGLGIIQKT